MSEENNENYKDLNLEREKIEQALEQSIKSLDSNAFFKKEQKSEHLFIYKLNILEKIASLNIYFKKQGTTTIVYKTGIEQELSYKIAKDIKEQTEITNKRNFSFQVTLNDPSILELLLEYLTEECEAEISDSSKETTYDIYKLKGRYNDHITIKLYTNRTLQIQGKPISLYKQIIYFLSEIVDKKEIIVAQSKIFNCNIDINVGEKAFKSRFFPTTIDFLGETLQNIIIPSLVISKIDVILTDYSVFVFPILKGLEGYIKKLFKEYGIIINSNGFSLFFDGGPDHSSILNREAKQTINNASACMAIELAYNFFKRQRHTLFHVDSYPSTTRTLSTREEAEQLIFESIDIFNESYAIISEKDKND